jgi:hypothetical protein
VSIAILILFYDCLGESEKYRELQQQAQLHMLQNQQAQQQAQEQQQQQQQLAFAAAESQLSPGHMVGHQMMMQGQQVIHPGQLPPGAFIIQIILSLMNLNILSASTVYY